MMTTRHRNPPRLWVIGVTCLFSLSLIVATLIVIGMFGFGRTTPIEIWGAMILCAVLLFGGIFACAYVDAKRLKRKEKRGETGG